MLELSNITREKGVWDAEVNKWQKGEVPLGLIPNKWHGRIEDRF